MRQTAAPASVRHDGSRPGQSAAPNLWAQAPEQRSELLVQDVHGTRLVILSGQPSGISTQDRSDLKTILASVQIG